MTLPSSADVLGPFLLLGLLLRLGGGRKLQHRCVLTFLKMGQKNLLAVWHFKDIVMNIRLVLVLLPEDGCREPALNAVAFARDPYPKQRRSAALGDGAVLLPRYSAHSSPCAA